LILRLDEVFMSDQAEGLRELIKAKAGEKPSSVAADARPAARSIVFTSGKGGVGTSNLALNLAIALGDAGLRVVLVDADLGLANLDLLCGLTPRMDLGDLLTGEGSLADALIDGPAGIRLLPGAHGARTLLDVLGDGPRRIVGEMASLDSQADFVVVDAGSGLGPAIGTIAGAADEVVVVTTPEPTSMADAQAAIHRLRRLSTAPRLSLVVNQANSAAEAADVLERLTSGSRQFLGAVVHPLGHVRSDPRVAAAVRERRPFLVSSPGGLAARGVRRLARSLLEESHPRPSRPGFFAALAARWALNRVAR